jgi:hypothetical protein
VGWTKAYIRKIGTYNAFHTKMWSLYLGVRDGLAEEYILFCCGK